MKRIALLAMVSAVFSFTFFPVGVALSAEPPKIEPNPGEFTGKQKITFSNSRITNWGERNLSVVIQKGEGEFFGEIRSPFTYLPGGRGGTNSVNLKVNFKLNGEGDQMVADIESKWIFKIIAPGIIELQGWEATGTDGGKYKFDNATLTRN